jgi:nicotinamide mononucleotide adenylyltransferase
MSSPHKISSPSSRSNPEKHVIFTYGRFQPPHVGHALLIHQVRDQAIAHHAIPYIIVSASCNDKWFSTKIYKSQREQNTFTSCTKNENPLTVKQRIHYLRKMFPDVKFISADDYGINMFKVIGHLREAGFAKFTALFGPDRATKFQRLFNRVEESSREKSEPPIHIDVEVVDNRIQSGTRMREAAVANTPAEIEYFREHTQIGNMTLEDTDQLREDIRKVLWKDTTEQRQTNKEAKPTRSSKKEKKPSPSPSPPPPPPPSQPSPSSISTSASTAPLRRSARLNPSLQQNAGTVNINKIKNTFTKYKLRKDEKI